MDSSRLYKRGNEVTYVAMYITYEIKIKKINFCLYIYIYTHNINAKRVEREGKGRKDK